MAAAGALAQGAVYQPSKLLREVAVDVRQAAVLFIDVQNYNCHRGGAMYRTYTPEELEGPEFGYWWARVDECSMKWAQLQQAARACNIEVMYTVIQSLTADGRERSLDYKISGFHVPPGCWDAKVIDAITPGPDEVILPKTSSSVFNSTTLDYILRNMDKRFLIIAGCVTDQCVTHAVKDAADLGYLVTLVEDCCATFSPERHVQALNLVSGYCRTRSLSVLLEEFMSVTARSTGAVMDYGPPGGPGAGRPGLSGATYGDGPGGLMGPTGSGGYMAASGGIGYGGGGLNGSVMDGGGPPPGYKRAYSAMMSGHGEHYSGDNFSPGLGGDEHSDDMDDDDDNDEDMDGMGRVRSSERMRGGYGGTSRRYSSRGRGRTVLASSGDKKVYFEYAKIQWESEREFMLPNGSSWVDVAIRGDPLQQERGLIFCRLCRHYNRNNVFGKGYRAGKRSALKEHMQTKDHKELVEALEAGLITMPSYSHLPMQPPGASADTSPKAAAAAAEGGLRPRRSRPTLVDQQQQQQQGFDALSAPVGPSIMPPPPPAAAAAAPYLQQQQQQQQQRLQPGAAVQAAIRPGTFDPMTAAAALMQMGGTAADSAPPAAAAAAAAGGTIPPSALLQYNLAVGSLAPGSTASAEEAAAAAAAAQSVPPAYNVQLPSPAAAGGAPNLQQHYGNNGTAAAAAAGKGSSSGAGRGNPGFDVDQLYDLVAEVAARVGIQTNHLADVLRLLQEQSNDMSPEEAADALSTALTEAARRSGCDSSRLDELLVSLNAVGGGTAAAAAAQEDHHHHQQQQQQQPGMLGGLAAGMQYGFEPSRGGMRQPTAEPGQRQQQQRHQALPEDQQQ